MMQNTVSKLNFLKYNVLDEESCKIYTSKGQ
jgi:hypothetical protein